MSEQILVDPCTIFVGNIPYSLTDNELRNLAIAYGEIAAATVVRDERARSRGFGFVRFISPSAAEAAIQTLHGSKLQERIIRVGLTRSDSRYLELVA